MFQKKEKGNKYFVTGIDTEIGKTIASAIIVEAINADYWKPVQSGDLDNTDTMKVKGLISNAKSCFHAETYRLKTPASPHYSAEIDGIEIDIDSFKLPETPNNLIVEGAGGLMVPLNNKLMIIDLIEQLKIPVILVSKHYLGSINHTILSIKALQQRNIEIAGIVFNGEKKDSTESAILGMTGEKELFRIPNLNEVSKESILKIAKVVGNKL